MESFRSFESTLAPMPESNIDTDQVIPARFLMKPRCDGCGPWLFHDLRFSPDGSKKSGFVLNQPRYCDARILAAGDNFGCGSSRENAVWALFDYGFRAVIAPGFGDIFFNNCLKNGLLPVRLSKDAIDKLVQSGSPVRVDLESQTVTCETTQLSFEIDPFAKHCLLNGLDELGYTVSKLGEIVEFEQHYEGTTSHT
jgi:3-isopropylmalate/(R)-2-methylmalate dehydratase small subunit